MSCLFFTDRIGEAPEIAVINLWLISHERHNLLLGAALLRRGSGGLAVELEKRGARVLIANLLTEEGINGPDDFVGTHGDRALFDLFDTATPYQHRVPLIIGSKSSRLSEQRL